MTAQIRILEWKAKGLRCPDHSVDLTNDANEPFPVSLIQMPNGTGKTTTLELLRAAMSGSATSWDKAMVSRYRKKNGKAADGSFELRLMLNAKLMTVIINFDFDSCTVSYKTTYGHGQENDFSPPYNFRKFMDENFVKFFIFDGELAQQLLDRSKTGAEAVVNHLFQIVVLKTLKNKVDEFWDEKTKGVTAKEDRGYKRRKKNRDDLRARLKELKESKIFYENRQKELTSDLETWNNKYSSEVKKVGEVSQRLTEAEEILKKAKSQAQEATIDLLDQMREPHALSTRFGRSIRDLKLGLDRVKLPESAAREFFEELAEEEKCVCGRPITPEIRETILKRSIQYLGSDDVALLNVIKTAVDESVGESVDASEKNLLDNINILNKLLTEKQNASNVVDEIRIEAESSDPEAKNARDQIDQIQLDLDYVSMQLLEFSDGVDRKEHTTDIKIVDKKLKKAEKDLAEVTETLELKQKRDVLMAICDKAFTAAKTRVIAEVCEEANSRIDTLMPNNNIRIETIDQSLLLEGQAGGSAGEELSIAYAFLSTLFERSEHQLPFVVDSPAGPIDLAIRPEIGKLVPKLSQQFIAFTISSEREGFVPSLKQASKMPVQFITLFRKGVSKWENRARTMSDCQESEDGILVVGEPFFEEFQLDTE